MFNYKKSYHKCFNAISDTIRKLDYMIEKTEDENQNNQLHYIKNSLVQTQLELEQDYMNDQDNW